MVPTGDRLRHILPGWFPSLFLEVAPVTLLNRYLLSQFIKFFLTVNSGFVAIYLLVDFFEK